MVRGGLVAGVPTLGSWVHVVCEAQPSCSTVSPGMATKGAAGTFAHRTGSFAPHVADADVGHGCPLVDQLVRVLVELSAQWSVRASIHFEGPTC